MNKIFTLLLELLGVVFFALNELHTLVVSFHDIFLLLKTALNDLGLELDDFFKLVGGLLKGTVDLLSVLFVLSTLFVKTKFKLSGLVAIQLDNIKISVFVHKIFQMDESLFDVLIDS